VVPWDNAQFLVNLDARFFVEFESVKDRVFP
jgi:hypothetical protein